MRHCRISCRQRDLQCRICLIRLWWRILFCRSMMQHLWICWLTNPWIILCSRQCSFWMRFWMWWMRQWFQQKCQLRNCFQRSRHLHRQSHRRRLWMQKSHRQWKQKQRRLHRRHRRRMLPGRMVKVLKPRLLTQKYRWLCRQRMLEIRMLLQIWWNRMQRVWFPIWIRRWHRRQAKRLQQHRLIRR